MPARITAWIARCSARLACLRDNFRADVDVLAGGGSLIRRTRTGSPWNEHTALPFAVWCGGSRSAASSSVSRHSGSSSGGCAARGRDGKGAWGQRAAELLGVIDRGDEEPDWRGDVEIKTVPVARTRDGLWRVVEDPAISTVGATPIAKLQRVLWLCRAEVPPDDATLLSWYLLEWDPVVATLVERYLHTRPKGPRGGRGRGYYLHKRFFAEAGLWASLNGPPVVETR